ncbi:lactonase family protein [Mesorhizobium plurifarium]|uniref:lactonase family protein n=1 Tax=Sinorhizobium arboris TaxID=76745 RepID=UPI0003FAC108|nr:lactonase family protein [Sinorhizobium arboris]PST20739.1 lactonase family protein [Mesorhizobium plurifarium]
MEAKVSLFAYVGCRTTEERNARGRGISVYRIDGQSSQWSLLQLLETEPNPSFLALHPMLDILYSVHGDLDLVTSYSINPETGLLRNIDRQRTRGRNPVHLALDPTHGWLIIANYRTDSIVSLPVSSTGNLGPVSHLAAMAGKLGPHRDEQNYGRPHQVPFSPSGKWILVPEKGFDQIVSFKLDPGNGMLEEAARCRCREASGPRHLAFHPVRALAYVLNELDSTVTTYDFDDDNGSLHPIDTVSSLPRDYSGDNRASEIALSKGGDYLYASNRGHDSIAVFRLGSNGKPASPYWLPSQGTTPRFFAFEPDEKHLYVANEDSDTIVEFRQCDPGNLVPTGQVIPTGSPTTIVFRKGNARSHAR